MSALVLLVTVLAPALIAIGWRRPKPARIAYPRTSNRRVRDGR